MPEHLEKPEDEKTKDTIEKRGEKYVLLSATGEVLGTHATEEEAREQERAIEASKAGRSGDSDGSFTVTPVDGDLFRITTSSVGTIALTDDTGGTHNAILTYPGAGDGVTLTPGPGTRTVGPGISSSVNERNQTADKEDWAYTYDFAPIKRIGTRDSNHFLRVPATVTAPGVYAYMRNGQIRHELKPPEEIFSALHMESVHGAVVTNEHPRGAVAVTPDNASEFQRGHSMSRPTASKVGMELDLVATDGMLIDDIESRRKTGVSLGLRNTFDHTPGVWTDPRDGSKHPYEVIQRNMITNHIAIVAEPRVTSAQLHLDSLDQDKQQQEEHMEKATLTIDEADFEVDKNVASIVKAHLGRRDKELVDLQAKLDEATTSYDSLTVEKDKMKAERDAAFAERDALKDKLASADALDVNALADKRLEFLDKTRKVLSAEKFSDVKSKSEQEIMKFTVEEHGIPTKDEADAYIKARFDILVEDVGKTNDSTLMRAAIHPVPAAGKLEYRTEINKRLKAHYDKQLGRAVAN